MALVSALGNALLYRQQWFGSKPIVNLDKHADCPGAAAAVTRLAKK